MPKSGQSRLEANRAIRREALLEQLQAACLIPKVVENIRKMEALDDKCEGWQRLDAATKHRMALLRKVLPDLKATELTGADGGQLFSAVAREIVDAKAKD